MNKNGEKPKKHLTSLAREYRTLDYEPLMLRATAMIQTQGRSLTSIQRECGVTAGTLRNWRSRKTHRPNSSTLRFVAKALGYKLDFIKE